MKNKKMTLRDVAGYSPEEAVWKMMADISVLLQHDAGGSYITPDSVLLDGSTFMLEAATAPQSEFLAPEAAEGSKPSSSQQVWSLGALAFYMVTGHVLFGGHGGRYQRTHPSVQIPVLPKGYQQLTAVLQQCLCQQSEQRVTLQTLHTLSQQGLSTCQQRQRPQQTEVKGEQKRVTTKLEEQWPEAMKAIG